MKFFKPKPDITWDKKKQKWKVCVKKKSQVEFLGYYSNKDFAINEYNRAMYELGLLDTFKDAFAKKEKDVVIENEMFAEDYMFAESKEVSIVDLVKESNKRMER